VGGWRASSRGGQEEDVDVNGQRVWRGAVASLAFLRTRVPLNVSRSMSCRMPPLVSFRVCLSSRSCFVAAICLASPRLCLLSRRARARPHSINALHTAAYRASKSSSPGACALRCPMSFFLLNLLKRAQVTRRTRSGRRARARSRPRTRSRASTTRERAPFSARFHLCSSA
jgi:hypothetical protein